MTQVWVHVAVGVIKNAQSQIFIAKRPDHVHQGGLWEFPGGKVEAGESVQQALARELHEELGIEVQSTRPLIQIRHDYGDKAVLLDVHWVETFTGVARGAEGQDVFWVEPISLQNFSFPQANLPIINAVQLPTQMAITPAGHNDLTQLEQWLDRTSCGLILRDPALYSMASAHDYIAARYELINSHADHCVMINTSLDVFVALREAFPNLRAGLHLNRHELTKMLNDADALMMLQSLNVRVGASCHNPIELEAAARINASYAILSPVNATASHPDAQPLGIALFSEWCRGVNLPVYGMGGLSATDCLDIVEAGGQGVAGISAFLGAAAKAN